MIQKLKDNSFLITYWPALSFMIVLVGYLTFYFYTNYQDIPFSEPSLILIIGLGIFVCMLVALTFYLGYQAKQTPKLSWAFSLAFFMNVLTQDSSKITAVIMVFLTFYYLLYLINPRPKKNTGRLIRYPVLFELINTLVGLAFGVFYDSTILLVFPSIFVLMIIVYYSKDSLQKIIIAATVSLVLTCAILPPTLLKNINYTFFGLTRMKAKIIMNDNSFKNGIVKFQDNNYLYMEDSLKQTMLIPKSQVFLVLKDKEDIQPISLITDIRNLGKNSR